jgi:virulence factor
MIKLGIVDCDTSHVLQFTMRHNHIPVDKGGIAEEQWVDGCKVVMAYRGTSKVTDDKTIDERVKQLKKWGVKIVANREDMIGKVDGVLIESNQGSQHLKHAKVFMKAGLPCYIDKPFTNSAKDALMIRDLAAKYNVPFFSSSSLRYAPEVVAAKAELGNIFGVDAWSPASLHKASPGLAHYGRLLRVRQGDRRGQQRQVVRWPRGRHARYPPGCAQLRLRGLGRERGPHQRH